MAEKEVIKVGRPIYPGEKGKLSKKEKFWKINFSFRSFPREMNDVINFKEVSNEEKDCKLFLDEYNSSYNGWC
ncbi:hypothetical protein J7K28_01345 [Candidatus Aerophobetes bacterium]|nr:hypothetical protein [Candidatus Aerophobetes bacterium]